MHQHEENLLGLLVPNGLLICYMVKELRPRLLHVQRVLQHCLSWQSQMQTGQAGLGTPGRCFRSSGIIAMFFSHVSGPRMISCENSGDAVSAVLQRQEHVGCLAALFGPSSVWESLQHPQEADGGAWTVSR